jgi:histidinol dehydrogenase
MAAVPAHAAGVREIVAVCPRPDATILHAARVAGVSRLFRLGGAHAIAALAYGTETVPSGSTRSSDPQRVVAAAKPACLAGLRIDFYASPVLRDRRGVIDRTTRYGSRPISSRS